MSVRTFIDTNVLVYIFDSDARSKQDRARQILQERAETVVLST
jgi:predicted nucleic acid-binding protein